MLILFILCFHSPIQIRTRNDMLFHMHKRAHILNRTEFARRRRFGEGDREGET